MIKLASELGFKTVVLEGSVVLVEEEKSLSYNGDYYLSYPNYNTVHRWNMEGMHEGKSVWINRIVASTEKMDGINLLEIEDEVIGKDLEDYIRTKANQDRCVGFIDGYTKAKEKYEFTREDLIKAIDMARLQGEETFLVKHSDDEIIESLSKKDLWIECERIMIVLHPPKFDDVPRISEGKIKAVWK